MRKFTVICFVCILPLAYFIATRVESAPPVELSWKLPEGRILDYRVRVSSQSNGTLESEADAELAVTLRAIPGGMALADMRLVSMTGTVMGEPIPQNASTHQAFELRTLLSTKAGFDPLSILLQQQRNLLNTLFPLPRKPVRKGEEWPMSVQLMSENPGAAPTEESVAAVESITEENGSRLATIRIRSGGNIRSQSSTAVKMDISGTSIFDLTEGFSRRTSLRATMNLSMGEVENVGMVNTIELALASASTMGTESIAEANTIVAIRQATAQAIRLSQDGDHEEAIRVVGGLCDTPHHEEHVQLILAQLYGYIGRWEDARTSIEAELTHNPDHIQTLKCATTVYAHLQDQKRVEEIQQLLQQISNGDR